jgi:enoyl-CoA hydratase/carnithine racemase
MAWEEAMASRDDGGTVRLTLESTPQGPVGRLVIEHPERRNAIGPAVIAALAERCEELARNDQLRLVTIRGAYGVFAAGANVKIMAGLDPEGARAFISSLHRSIDALRRLPVPVIAVLESYCFGAAMELAAACDMRLAADNLVAGMPEVRVGIPSVIEACLLPRLIGWGRTSELLLTGRSIDAEEALRIGFVERVVPQDGLVPALEEWTRAILDCSPGAIRAQKAVMRGWEADEREGVRASIDAFAECFRSGEPARRMAPAGRSGAGTRR